MKKLLLFVLLLVSYQTMAQTLSSALNAKFYVQGISVTDTLFLNEYYSEVDKVKFYALNAAKDTIKQYVDSDSTDGFNWILDMSQLTPDSKIEAQMFISETKEGDPINDFLFTVIPTPEWLKGDRKGTVNNVLVSGTTLSFEGRYPIYDYNYVFNNDVKLLGNKTLGVAGNFIFNATYNLTDGSSRVVDNKTTIDVNILNYSQVSENINYDAELIIDKNLNISIYASKSIKSKSVNWDSPNASFPVCPGFSVEFSASLEFYATLKGQIVIGQKEGKFGFLEDGQGRKTKIIGVVTGIGTVRGGVSVLGGVAKATASLTAKANLGAGFDFVSVPSMNSNFLYGGDFDLSGFVEINLFDSRRLKKWLGIKPKNVYSDSLQLYYTRFGDTTLLRSQSSNHYDPMFNTMAFTIKDSGSLVIPEFKPQPTFASNSEKLYATWIEEVNDNFQILISEFNNQKNKFESRKIIASSDFPKSNPKIGVLTDGSILVTWTQLRYNQSNVTSDVTINDLLKAQDIWFAFYDAETNAILKVDTLNDQSNSLTDGRAEGQANISVGSNNEAMITWVSLNENTNSSDIWFSSLSKKSNEWEMTQPSKLIDIPGTNTDVNVIYGDSSVALAVWINDVDGKTETLDKEIVYAGWNGEEWDKNVSVIASNDGTIDFKNLSLATNNSKIAMAYTSVENDTIDISKINLEVFDLANDKWDENASFQDTSDILIYQCPQTSISAEGFVSVAYQVIDKYNTAENIDNGELYLYVKDLNKSDSEWKEITGNTNLCDTNTFIWDMTAGFGPDNQYYVMTQEYSDDGVVKNPHSGVLFGDPELSMVLRGLKVNNDLTISDIEEPDTKTTRLQNVEAPKFRYNNNYPNPFEQFTTIEFSLYTSAHVTLEIFNYTGTKVATLIDSQMAQGIYKTNFDAGDLPGGIYYSKLTVDGNASTGKMIIMK